MRTLAFMEDELVIVASPRHPLARRAGRSRVSIAALRQADWLLREPGSGTREAVEQALLPHLARLRSGVELGSAEAIKLGAAEGWASPACRGAWCPISWPSAACRYCAPRCRRCAARSA